MGGWSISGDFNIKNWDFQKALELNNNYYDATSMFSSGVMVDLKNTTRARLTSEHVVLFTATLPSQIRPKTGRKNTCDPALRRSICNVNENRVRVKIEGKAFVGREIEFLPYQNDKM
ncbi:endothelin-converting enzyme-like protein [Trichonephila clavipes]|nr:endothelin-converting enzyme-like protein [Trichonephila clavipes]